MVADVGKKKKQNAQQSQCKTTTKQPTYHRRFGVLVIVSDVLRNDI